MYKVLFDVFDDDFIDIRIVVLEILFVFVLKKYDDFLYFFFDCFFEDEEWVREVVRECLLIVVLVFFLGCENIFCRELCDIRVDHCANVFEIF